MPTPTRTPDEDRHKGAVESDDPREKGNTSMPGQLPHRGQDPLIKSSDTDFPEPGENPEHSGEPEDASLLETDQGCTNSATSSTKRASTEKKPGAA